MLLELSGLWKAYGFPIIDVEKSARSLIDSCSRIPVTASSVPRELRNLFVKIMRQEHFKRHKFWPPLEDKVGSYS
jgi:hypothetical protein